MNSQQLGASDDSGGPPTGRRLRWLTWSMVGLLAYGGFVALCFYMESNAHARFQVPSKADIAAIDDRESHLRAETARGHALAEMRDWAPYSIYSTGVGIVVFLGT